MSAATSLGDTLTWNERRFMIRSVAHAERLQRDFLSAIEKAKTAIETLNERKQGKRRRRERAEVDAYISTVLKRYNISELLTVTVHETNTSVAKRAYKPEPQSLKSRKILRSPSSRTPPPLLRLLLVSAGDFTRPMTRR